MANEIDELLDDDGLMEMPTMRGNSNLDVQDYANADSEGTFLDDELDEFPVPKQNGAASATDVEGTSDFDLLDDDEPEAPGMRQTTYGSHPWQIGSGSGYRPFSQQTTDLSGESRDAPEAEVSRPDSEVRAQRYRPSQRNPQPSNEDIDPLTEYDRTSYEYSNSPGNVIGAGIFDEEEGVTFRPRDGIFANQYAQPSYIVDEDSEGVQQSEMWNVVTDNWTVTQVNASGVPLSRDVRSLRPAPAPFAMLLNRGGPRSHIEAFGRIAARSVLGEARLHQDPRARSVFLSQATEALGPQMSLKAKAVAERLVRMGYPQETALEDVVAHCIMHATMRDLSDRARGAQGLRRLDRMTSGLRVKQGEVRQAAAEHLQPIVNDQRKLTADLGAFHASSAATGLGQIDEARPAQPATQPVPASPAPQQSPGWFSLRNVIIGASVLGVGYLAATQTDAGRQVTANVTHGFRRLTGQKKRRGSRRARRV